MHKIISIKSSLPTISFQNITFYTKLKNFLVCNYCISKCLGITGLVLQVAALYSSSWVRLQLMLVPMCDGRTPVLFETECPILHYNPQEVSRAGLWKVCHSFPFGSIAVYYYHSEPYCSNFSDDERQENWLEMSQYQCQLAIALNIVGLTISTLAGLARHNDINWIGATIQILSGGCGFLGATTYYMNISKNFLIDQKLNFILLNPYWAFYCFIDGSILTLLAGVLEKKTKY